MNQKLKVGIVSDGKYGTRAYENIKSKFNVEWILVPEIAPNVMIDDDLDIEIPYCDLYISYARHPDIIMQLAELQKPLILGIVPGIGLYFQAKSINSNVIHAPTMCSLEDNSGILEVDLFTKYFGRPIYEIQVSDGDTIEEIKVKRSSLCGSTDAGAEFLKNKQLNEENLQNFALSVCYECRAPRFGKTCDKEVAGIIHLVSLFEGIPIKDCKNFDEDLKIFIENIKEQYEQRKENSRIVLKQVN